MFNGYVNLSKESVEQNEKVLVIMMGVICPSSFITMSLNCQLFHIQIDVDNECALNIKKRNIGM